MRIGLLLLICVGICIASAEEPPRWESLANLSALDQNRLLQQWATSAQNAREKDSKWTPGGEWRDVLVRLKNVPREQPQLRQAASAIFQAIGDNSDECLDFCSALAQCKEGEPEENIGRALLLLKSISARRGRARDLVMALSQKLQNPSYAYDFLSKGFPDDPAIKGLILHDLSNDAPARKNAAIQSIPKLKFDKAEAAQVLKQFMLSADNDTEARQFAPYVEMSLQQSPSTFRRSIQQADSTSLLKITESKPLIRDTSLACLLIASSSLPDDFAEVLLDKFSGKSEQHAMKWLAALGFLRIEELKGERSRLLESAKNTMNEGRVGLFSIYCRTAKSADSAILEWKTALGREWLPDQLYWESFIGSETAWPVAPEKWRTVWEDSFRSVEGIPKSFGASNRKMVLKSIVTAPEAAEAAWVLGQSLADSDLKDEVLPTLWRMRNVLNKCRLDEKMKAWLRQQAQRPDAKQALTPASILLFACDDNETCKGVLDKISDADLFVGARWPFAVDVLLKLDPADKRLDVYREMLAKSDAKWLIWLLDLKRRTNKEAPPPPIESLAEALRGTQSTDIDWLSAFSSAGEPIYPFLDDLRSPYLFVAGSGQSLNPILRFLGALDRLEVAKRKAQSDKK